MSLDPASAGTPAQDVFGRHASLDDRLDPAIVVIDHDRAWAPAALDERVALRTALGPLATSVDHIGSTAVPGLAAKPIIDLLVTVPALEPSARYVAALESLGYLYVPDPEDSPGRRFFAKPALRPRSHHVHVCEADGDDALRHLAVRDYLRAHPAEVVRYAGLKRDLAIRHPQDRLAYIAGKAGYLEDLERRSLDWAHAEGR